MYNIVIVRYGEIFLKSEPVRKRFEQRLLDDIRHRLKGTDFKIKRKRHRIYVVTRESEKAAALLTKIFGIVSVSPAVEAPADMDEITKKAVALAKDVILPNETFAVRAERTGNHEFSSKDIEEKAGEAILNSLDTTVNLSSPDKTIFVEIRDDAAFIFDRKIRGPGGLPSGTQGKLISLLSGGIDSPVATWMMMKRGCSITALHAGNEKEMEPILKKLREYSGDIELKCFDISGIQKKASEVAGKFTCLICKRTMYRVAEILAEREHALGICTGESMGQVASQTLDNLKVLDNAASLPVYRPLIGMDKEDTIAIAKRIGTFKHASTKGCDFVPKKPSTRADLAEIEKLEEKLGIHELIEKCLPP